MKLSIERLVRRPAQLLLPGLVVVGLGLFDGGCSGSDDGPDADPITPSEGGRAGAPSTNPGQGGQGGVPNSDPNDLPGPLPEPDDSEPLPGTEIPDSLIVQPASEEPGHTIDGAIDWLDGFWQLASTNASIAGGTQITVPVSAAVNVVAQEKLIAFIETHPSLFAQAQREALTQHAFFTERGHGAGLLMGMLGLALENDFDYFSVHPSAPMLADTDAEAQFLDALGALDEEPYTLQGRQDALATSAMPVRPRLFAHVTRLRLPNGKKLRAIDTRLYVTDQNGGTGAVGLKNQQPLVLASDGSSPEPLQVAHRYGTLFTGTAELEAGASIKLPISKEVNCVSHAGLVAWLTKHPELFTDAEKAAITNEAAFTDETAAPELLHGILGVKLAGSFQFFAQVSQIQIPAYTPDDQQFVSALSELRNQSYVLGGSHTVKNVGSFAEVPNVFVRTTRVDLPGGAWFRVLNTRAEAGDSTGSRVEIQSDSGSAALELRPN